MPSRMMQDVQIALYDMVTSTTPESNKSLAFYFLVSNETHWQHLPQLGDGEGAILRSSQSVQLPLRMQIPLTLKVCQNGDRGLRGRKFFSHYPIKFTLLLHPQLFEPLG